MKFTEIEIGTKYGNVTFPGVVYLGIGKEGVKAKNLVIIEDSSPFYPKVGTVVEKANNRFGWFMNGMYKIVDTTQKTAKV